MKKDSGIRSVILFKAILLILGIMFMYHMYMDHQTHQSEYAILTMQELGYENHVVLSSYYKENAEYGNRYELEITNTNEPVENLEDNDYVCISLTVTDVDEMHDPDTVLREYMTKEKDVIASNHGEGYIDLIGDAWNEENIYDYYVDMKDIFPNVDKAYALYDGEHITDNGYDRNEIFLMKGQRIVNFAYLEKSDFTLNDTRIEVMESLFEREIK